MDSKWTGGDLGPTGASNSGLSPSTPGSDWPPPPNNVPLGPVKQVSTNPTSTEPTDQSPPAAEKGMPLT